MQRICNYLVILTVIVAMVGCGGGATATREELSDLKPYNSASQYRDQLVPCAMANAPWSSCALSTLPPLAMEIPEPSFDDVMSRVVVSHDWMGQRFEQLLERLPKDMLYLFGAVTAIVIDADIRPSYYWNITGAIYLDPASLWLTLEEKDSINRKQDYRAGNESEMRFRVFSRLAIDGADAYRGYGLDSTEERTIDDIVIPMANLLFHELAHANDHLARKSYADVDVNRSISSITDSLRNQYPSTRLKKDYPLQSDVLFQVADIFYRGYQPTEEQTFWTAAMMGEAFATDGASDIYNYSSQFEDLAMLFEDAMMYIHFNVIRELAFIETPDQVVPGCGDLTIAWGQRNRIGDPWTKQRVQFVLQEILPDRDYRDRVDALADPTPLTPGTDWCEMVNQQRALSSQLKQHSSRPELQAYKPNRYLQK